MKLTGRAAGRVRRARLALEQNEQRKFKWQNPKLGRVERVIAFLEQLPITKGKLAGKEMRLLPGQKRFVRKIYGGKNGKRVRLAIKSEPRGNGKTGLLAGLSLCHLIGPEAERRGEVYSAAIDRQQAGLMYNEMEAIIKAVPEYSARCNLQRFHKRIEVMQEDDCGVGGPGEGSIYEALSADARRAHGLAPTLWVYDELAQAKDRELLDNLMTAMGKRKHALGIVISTQAPSDDHPLSQLIDDGLRGDDKSIVVDLLCAPDESDPFSRNTIEACNPALGKFLDADDLMSEAERARRIPAFEPAFKNLRLNQRVDSNADARIVNAAIWKKGAVSVDPEKLAGRECYGGLDLSGKHDLCALELGFPDDEDGFDILSFFWTPEGQLEARKPSERDAFKLWIEKGHLIAVPGPTVRFSWVAREVARLCRKYRIKAIGYDRWRIDDFKQDLNDAGCDVTLEPYGQGFKDMAPAIELFAEKAMNGQLRHGGHPVLSACVANAVLVSDAAGNQKFDKERSSKASTIRIDGATALATMIGTAARFGARPEPKFQMLVLG